MRRVMMFGLAIAIAGCSAGARTAIPDEPEDKGEKPAPKEAKGEPFKLPGDAAGRLLGAVLPPSGRPGLLENPARPAPPAAPPPKLDGLEPALPDMPGPAPRFDPRPKRGPKPRVVVPAPTDEGFGEPLLPGRPAFGTLGKTFDASEHPLVPPPLPILADKPADRVPLDDPTLEASGLAVLEGVMPERAVPVPYVRTAVPEPFELRTPLAVTPPPERTTPQR